MGKHQKTTEEFVEMAKAVFGDKYDYSLTVYKTNKEKVDIICPKHGVFAQLPQHHLEGHGCRKCYYSRIGDNRRLSLDEFVRRAKKKHGDSYDYSNVVYVNNSTLVDIICPKHGVFNQMPSSHMFGRGCPKCGYETVSKKLLTTEEDFLLAAKRVHGDKYDYSKVSYHGYDKKIEIICKRHGPFFQIAKTHAAGHGCPICNESRGESFINKYLSEHKIMYERQKRLGGLRNKLPLSFDFFLPDMDIAIEYNGEQHYEPIAAWGGLKKFNSIIHRDQIKRDYCAENGIKLIEIRYDQNVEEELNKYLL